MADETDPRVAAARSTASTWRRAVPTIAAFAFAAVCVVAGNWQRGRWHEKEALAEAIAAAQAAPPVPFSRIDADAKQSRFRVVEATGRFDARHQILLDNRVHAGRVGYHAIAPLILADGRTVLVNRGFVPAGRSRSDVPEAPPPDGEVTIRGRINVPPPRWVELGDAPSTGRVWQNFDLQRYEAATGLRVPPLVIEQTGGPADGLVRDWPNPDAGSATNLSYMLQWYAFAALAVALWLYFTLRRRR